MTRLIRTALLIAASIAVGAVGIMALRPSAVPAPFSSPVAAPVELALERPIPEVFLENVPLSQAAAELTKLTGVPIELDVEGMQRYELSPAKPVTVRLRNDDLMSVLGSVVTSYNANRVDPLERTRPEIVWCVGETSIILGVWERIQDRALVATRVYDITPLSAEANKANDPMATVLGPTDSRDEVIELAHEMVAPASWQHNGGSGVITRVGNRVIAVQSIGNHVHLRRLLNQLTETPSPAKAVPVTNPEVWSFHPELKRWTSESSERGETGLRRVLATFEVTDCPLGEALDRLSFAAELDVLPNAGSNLPLDRKISLALRNAPAWRVLREILNRADTERTAGEAARARNSSSFNWWLHGAVVVVGRNEPVQAVYRVYDIRPYLAREYDVISGPGPSGSPSIEVSGYIDYLGKSIMEAVDPASWRENGGEIGVIRVLSRQLLIGQTWENHETIAPLIEQLTRAAATRPTQSPPEGK